MSVSHKLGLVSREMFENEGCEIPVLSEVKQILHVQCVYSVFLVFTHDLLRHKQGLVRIGCAKSIDGEASWQAGNRSKERLERFRKVMGNEILVDLPAFGDQERTAQEEMEMSPLTDLHHGNQ